MKRKQDTQTQETGGWTANGAKKLACEDNASGTVPIVTIPVVPLSLQLSPKIQRPSWEHPMKQAWVSHLARLQLPSCMNRRELPPFMEEWELALRTPDTAALISLWFLGDTRVKGSLERSPIQPVPGQRSALK